MKLAYKKMLANFLLSTPAEVAAELGRRLKAIRLNRGLRQEELARMAGLSRGALAALENRGKSTLETLLRVTSSLGVTQEMESLFAAKPVTIAQLEAASKRVQRAPRKRLAAKGAATAGKVPRGPNR
jgi:putative transcriptional regulator